MTIVVFVLASLRPGVDPDEYERYVREVDYPTSVKLTSIVSYRTHRLFEAPPIAGGPWQYVERIEITDRAAYEHDLTHGGKELIDELLTKYLDPARTHLLWTERIDP